MRTPWLIALLLAEAAAFGAYAYTFGPGSHWQPSAHPLDWAHFGEYIGGMSVPLLLLGLFANGEGRWQRIESQHQQGTLDELMREARGLALGLEQILAEPIESVALTAQPLSAPGRPATVGGVLELADAPAPPLSEAKGVYRKAIDGSAVALAQKLDLLAAVLSEFVSRGGDSIFLLFYRDRFRATVRRLRGMETSVSTGDWWLESSEDAESRRWRF
jgi:hypothetical protein